MEKLKNIKEKVKMFADSCKSVCVHFNAKSVPFFGRIIGWAAANKKNILVGIVATAVLAGAGTASFYVLRWYKYKDESPTFAAIRKGELAATGQVGSKIVMGDLEISFLDMIEDTYHPLEVDENFKRLPPRGYFGAQVLIFNTGYNQKENLIFGLTDDFGNQYERDKDIDFYLDGVRDFGPAIEIYPRTIRGGDIGSEKVYLLFPAPDPNAKKLQLIVMSETQNKKVIFEIER